MQTLFVEKEELRAKIHSKKNCTIFFNIIVKIIKYLLILSVIENK